MAWYQPARSSSWQDSGMERVLGIGGYFMRAADPAALSAWYRDCLGLDVDENGLWRQGAGLTVFATFESETDYFGSRAQQSMLDFRVRDLNAMLAQLREHRIQVAGPEVEHGLLGAGPEVVGLGIERREHRRPGFLAPQAVLVGVQAQAIAIPRAQGRRVGGPHEVSTDSEHA